MKNKDERKAKIVTIGDDKRKKIPQLFTDVYKIETSAVTDGENVNEDETFKLHTLRTVFVEGLSIVDNGKAVNVNGDIEISLEDENDDTEDSLRNRVYADKDEAVKTWRYLTKLQIDRAESMQKKIEQTLVMLTTSLEDKQY